MNGKNSRNSNIELLRILAVGGVTILHYNYNHAFSTVNQDGTNYLFLMIMESLCICAVDLFMLISGYFSWKNKVISVIKIADLLVETIFIQIVFGVISALISGTHLEIKNLVRMMIPVNYYVVLYLVVYVISPFLNSLICILSKRQFSILVGLLMLLFSVLPYLTDTFTFLTGFDINDMSTISRKGSGYGYTIINFLLMYIIGAYIGKYKPTIKKMINIVDLFINWGLLTVLGLFGFSQGYDFNFSYSYCNPIVIMLAVNIFFMAIYSKRQFISKPVNIIASGVFTVYLLQGYCLNYINIESVVNKSLYILVAHLFISTIAIILIGFVVSLVWNRLELLVNGLIKRIFRNTTIDFMREV